MYNGESLRNALYINRNDLDKVTPILKIMYKISIYTFQSLLLPSQNVLEPITTSSILKSSISKRQFSCYTFNQCQIAS